MAKVVIDGNQGSGRTTYYRETGGKSYIQTEQDCEHIIKAASILSEETPGKDFRHAAFIPDEVMNQAMVEGWFHDKAAWKRWANDPNNARFRTWKGRM